MNETDFSFSFHPERNLWSDQNFTAWKSLTLVESLLDTFTLGRQGPDGGKDGGSGRRREHAARHAGRQHPRADVASTEGLVTTAAPGDYGHLVTGNLK